MGWRGVGAGEKGWVVGAGSQKVVVIEELGVLASFPQAEETEVEVHLDHLFAWGEGWGEKQGYRYTLLCLPVPLVVVTSTT